jgi:pimeloyl-ACP methyl ester carboxylesterase
LQGGTVRPRRLTLLILALAVAGCSVPRQSLYSPPPVLGEPGVLTPGACRGLIFVADGAGNFRATSLSLQQVVAQQRVGLQVRPFLWSHGCPRVLADHTDYAHARLEGQELAGQIVAFRQSCPEAEVYLVGHSAGCAVVLAAAECLPPDSVDDIVLLAPALSADYDVRPALRCARQGIDVFYSDRDWVYLGFFTGLVGTSDRHWSAVSGRAGFHPRADGPADSLLLARLRQHPWQPSYAASGNLGGHYGGYQPNFLRLYVLPLLQRYACQLP